MTTATISSRKIKMSYVHVAIMLILTFGIGFLPPFAQITEVGMRVLGVFIGMLYGWIFIDLLWPSLLGFVTLGLTGYISITESLSAGFGDSNFVTCIVCSLFAAALSEIGVSNSIAYWLLGKKVFIGRPWLLISAICVCGVLMGFANGGMATIFLLWSIVASICEISGYGKQSRVSNMMIALIVYIAMTAQCAVPFYPGPILYGSYMTKVTGVTIPTGPFFAVAILYVIGCVAGLLLISKYILKVDAKNFSTTEALCQKYREKKPDIYQKVGLILLAAFFLVVLIPEVVFSLPYRDQIRSIGMVGFAVFYMVVFVVWRKEDGKPVLNIENCFHGIPWAVMILLAVTYPLAAAMESEEVGITASINQSLVPLLTDMSANTLILASAIVLGIVTQVMHNIVMGAVFIPIITPLVIDMGGNPVTAFFMMYFSLMCAYVTPAGSMMAGLVFGHKDMARKDAYIFGLMFLLVNFIMLIILMPLCNMLFPF